MRLWRRFWNWLRHWWRGDVDAARARVARARVARSREIERLVAKEITEGRPLDEQIAEELAKPEIAKHVVVSPKKKRKLQRALGDRDPGDGSVRGHDGVWRAKGDTPFESIRPYVGSEEEAQEAAKPKMPRRPVVPSGRRTCTKCFGWGDFLGKPGTKCQTCGGKGWT